MRFIVYTTPAPIADAGAEVQSIDNSPGGMGIPCGFERVGLIVCRDGAELRQTRCRTKLDTRNHIRLAPIVCTHYFQFPYRFIVPIVIRRGIMWV